MAHDSLKTSKIPQKFKEALRWAFGDMSNKPKPCICTFSTKNAQLGQLQSEISQFLMGDPFKILVHDSLSTSKIPQKNLKRLYGGLLEI